MARAKKFKPEIVNKVTVRGTIREVRRSPNALFISLITRNPVTNRIDFPVVVAFDNLDTFSKICVAGERVTVEGRIQTSKTHPASSIVAYSINQEKDRLNAAFEEEEFNADVNKVLLQGTVSFPPVTSTTSDLVMLTVRVDSDGRDSYPRLYAFSKSTRAVAEAKRQGDPVRILAYMSSHTFINKNTGMKRREQTLIIQNIE